jgi:hypothetical protein
VNRSIHRTRDRIVSRAVWERLEGRVLLCATVEQLIEAGIPASMISDSGHISRADYVTLSPDLQRHVDPHFIEETYNEPIDYDQILGIPTSVSGRDNPEALTYPDWYPAINGSISINQTSQPGRTLLWFPTAINNQGSGPGIGISGRPGIDPIPSGAPITSWLNPDGSQAVLQPIYEFNGSSYVLSHYRNAGAFTYHAGHSHFHYDGYNDYRLRHNVGGQPGAYVQRPDGTEIIGEKIGFCLINVGSSFTMENGQSSTSLPGYNAPGQPSTGCGFTQGVHVGKYDQYGAGTSGQWLDVTGVPNGNYFLEITVDGENVMEETNETNNTKNFPVTINVSPPVGGIAPDQFDTGGNNNTFANATDVGVMGTFVQPGLTIHWGQDYDFFRFTASSSGTYTVTATPANGNVDLYLYNANQQLLGSSTNPSGGETISHSFVGGQTYYIKAETYNSSTSSNYQVAWNLLPSASATTPDAVANEFGTNYGIIALGRNGPVINPLNVNFTVGGTATRGVDYEIYKDGFLVTGTSIAIDSTSQASNLEIRPLPDGTPEAGETVIITLANGAGYVVGSGNSGTVTIGDSGPEVSAFTQVWQTSPHRLIFDIDRADAASIALGDFQVVNLDTTQTVNPQSVGLTDFGSFVRATVNFSGVLADARYRVTIASGAMLNTLGEPNFGSFQYDFFVLSGDGNHDGRVNLSDFDILAANFGLTGRDGSTGDLDYDGDCDLDDFTLFTARFGNTILSPDGGLAARGRSSPFADGGSDDKDRLEELA